MKRMIRRRTNQPPPVVVNRSEIIGFEGLRHAPENELGVVFLFSKVARRLGFVEIDRIQPQFPDCYAIRKTTKGTARTWIEFEFKSRSFSVHIPQLSSLTPRKGLVVCWEHNWPECERHAEVVELRELLGFGRRVWIQNTRPTHQPELDTIPYRKTSNFQWTVAPRARPGDIVLMYRAGTPAEARRNDADVNLLQSIANVFLVKSRPRPDKRWGHQAEVAQVAVLEHPLRLAQMRSDAILKDAPFVRASMLGRWDATLYWYRLYNLLVKLNPKAAYRLERFAPDKL